MCADYVTVPSRARRGAGMTIRVVIADDEPPARRKLRRLLAVHADVAIAGEASTGTETADLLKQCAARRALSRRADAGSGWL